MDRLIYTAMTGASHVLQQQAAVSENLANASTPGFRAALNTFRAVPLVGEGLPTRTFVVDSTAGADFTPAPFHQTGRDLDVAVNGAGWIAVQGPDGKDAYTRNGSFQVTPNGVLQTRTGLDVLGDGGPITIPPDTEVTFAKDGTISTVPSSGQATSVVVVGRLKLVNPPPEQLERGVEKFFYVLEGSIKVKLGEEEYLLNREDTLYFDGSIPHQLINAGNKQAKIFCAVSPSKI